MINKLDYLGNLNLLPPYLPIQHLINNVCFRPCIQANLDSRKLAHFLGVIFSSVPASNRFFLIAISQPVNRPTHIHEYMLTKNSLYAAVSVQLQKEDIIKVLNNICKNAKVPDKVIKFIDECTSQYGQAKLVLKDNKYFIESFKKNVIDRLMQLPSVSLGNHRVLMDKQNKATNNNETNYEVSYSISLAKLLPI